MEWIASTLHTTSEHGVYSITTADLNGLVRFAERRNLVSVRVPSHFKRSLPLTYTSVCNCNYHSPMSVYKSAPTCPLTVIKTSSVKAGILPRKSSICTLAQSREII